MTETESTEYLINPTKESLDNLHDIGSLINCDVFKEHCQHTSLKKNIKSEFLRSRIFKMPDKLFNHIKKLIEEVKEILNFFHYFI